MLTSIHLVRAGHAVAFYVSSLRRYASGFQIGALSDRKLSVHRSKFMLECTKN
jgi:hypothetical protein